MVADDNIVIENTQLEDRVVGADADVGDGKDADKLQEHDKVKWIPQNPV